MIDPLATGPSSGDYAAEQQLSVSALAAYPRLSGLYGYWDAKRGARSMPSRADITPEEMLSFLGHVLLVDVEHAPRRFRFRLVGTEIVDSYGIDLTGKYTDAVMPDSYRRLIERHYTQAVDARSPVVHRMEFSEWPGKVHELIRLTLPLSDDDDRVNMLLAGSVFGAELRHFRARERGRGSNS